MGTTNDHTGPGPNFGSKRHQSPSSAKPVPLLPHSHRACSISTPYLYWCRTRSQEDAWRMQRRTRQGPGCSRASSCRGSQAGCLAVTCGSGRKHKKRRWPHQHWRLVNSSEHCLCSLSCHLGHVRAVFLQSCSTTLEPALADHLSCTVLVTAGALCEVRVFQNCYTTSEPNLADHLLAQYNDSWGWVQAGFLHP